MNRDALSDLLASQDIFARKYFFPLVTDYACYRDKFTAQLPVAKRVANSVLTLPLWGDIPDEAIDRISELIRQKK